MTHNKADNRIGKFKIYHDMLRNGWHDLLPIMGNFVIVQASMDWATSATEYVAYSPLFDVVDDGVSAPEYALHIAIMPDGPALIKAEKL